MEFKIISIFSGVFALLKLSTLLNCFASFLNLEIPHFTFSLVLKYIKNNIKKIFKIVLSLKTPTDLIGNCDNI